MGITYVRFEIVKDWSEAIKRMYVEQNGDLLLDPSFFWR